jgi:Na+/H+-dicarboxylate symporter
VSGPLKIRSYVWAFFALIVGVTAGGLLPDLLSPVAKGARAFIEFIVLLVPLLVFAALSPAVATLIRRGLAGRFVGAVIGWFFLTSILAGLLGILVASLLFDIPFSSKAGNAVDQAIATVRGLRSNGGVSGPLLAILAAVVVGLVGVKVDRLYVVLHRIELGVARLGSTIGYVMVPLILAFGIMIGVTFGARLGMSHYGAMIAYTAFMSLIWWLFYVFVLLRFLGGVRSPGRLLKLYYIPTALFAAGTCSSLATIPVNLNGLQRYGTRKEVADFVIPIGAVVNMDAGAMQFIGYAPFVAGYLFGLDVSWSLMLIAWPFVVLYTLASPGVPGAMGAALWSSVLFASLLGLEDPLRATFVGTWVALAGGLPDMFRTATNATADGFTTVIFSHNFDKYFARDRDSHNYDPLTPPATEDTEGRHKLETQAL